MQPPMRGSFRDNAFHLPRPAAIRFDSRSKNSAFSAGKPYPFHASGSAQKLPKDRAAFRFCKNTLSPAPGAAAAHFRGISFRGHFFLSAGGKTC